MPAKINANLVRISQKYLLLLLLYLLDYSSSLAQHSADSLNQQRIKIQDSLMMLGFWEANVTIDEQNEIDVQKGRAYVWSSIKVFEDNVRSEIPFVKNLKGQIANQYKLRKKLSEYVKTNYHREGYPLAKAILSFSDLDENQIAASINILPQNYILYDSIVIRGDSLFISKTYLSNLLDLKYNQPFDIKAFNSIADKLSELDYLMLSAPPELVFANNRAIIYLELTEKRSNQFDALVGLIPEGTQINLTGQVDARLRNLFKRGVGLDVFWQKYSANSQFLNTSIQQYHAFRSPLGINFGFELLQEDSTFLQTDFQLGALYPFWRSFNIGLSYQRFSNNVLRDFSEDEISGVNPFRSSVVNATVFNLNWKKPLTYPQLKDYLFASFNFSIGNKQIRNFSSLPEAWQQVPENSTTLSGGLKIHFQKMFGRRFLVEAIPQYRSIQNPALSQNDLLRLGGLQNLRGFDRNFFYTRYFGLLNLNYRYFLDQKSSFFLLTDLAKLQSDVGWIYATGAGLDIKSKNGWFRIIVAWGQNSGNTPDFSEGKVHFGYIAVF